MFFINANDVIYSSFLKYLSNKLRMAWGNKYELRFCFRFINQILQLLLTDKLTIAFIRLKKQEISFVFVLEMIVSNRLFIVENTVAWKVDSQWISY